MTIQDRRRQRQIISGRRSMPSRRVEIDDSYDGPERRHGGDRRTIIDRRR